MWRSKAGASARVGESYLGGNVTLLVLDPCESLYDDKKQKSVVVAVSYGAVDFLRQAIREVQLRVYTL